MNFNEYKGQKMRQLIDMNGSTLIHILEEVVDNMADWLIIGDEEGKIIYVNEALIKDCIPGEEKILGQDMYTFLGMKLPNESGLKRVERLPQEKKVQDFITTRVIKNNKRIYLANQLFDYQDHAAKYYVCISKDITHTHNLREEVYKANYFDSLTGYPNYKVFLEKLSYRIAHAEKIKERFAVVFVDIKGVGTINYLHSMAAGDLVIREVGRRLEEAVGAKQEIFRCKENIFAILCQDKEEVLPSFINRLYEKMETPVKMGSREVLAPIHVGVACYPKDGLHAEQLVDRVQTALMYAKKEQKESCIFYSKEIQDIEDQSQQAELDLQKAVNEDEFIVYYQPFVDLQQGKLVGMEALVRRQKKDGEIIPPNQFISRLEEMDLIEKVGMSILEKVCMQLRQWMNLGYEVVPVSVNLSPKQFKNPRLADNIEEVLRKYNIDARYVVLEITESTVMEDVGIATQSVEKLKKEGFAISIDDFGTGYASIGYLKKFMFDHLKIDISFVREIVANRQDRSIVQAIIAIAKTLNLTTIAEGIENEEQLYVMSTLGCEMGQGFFWDRPIGAQHIEAKYFIA